MPAGIFTKSVTVATTAGGTEIVAANARRMALVISVPAAGATVYVGPSGLTASGTAATNGLDLAGGEKLGLTVGVGDRSCCEAFYGIVAAGTQEVRVLEAIS